MVYLAQIEHAYNMVKGYEDGYVTFGKKTFELHKLTNNLNGKYIVTYTLLHLGTWILDVEYNFQLNTLTIRCGGYSATDRNNINALLQCMEIYFTQASIKSGCLMLNYNGRRTKQITVKMIP